MEAPGGDDAEKENVSIDPKAWKRRLSAASAEPPAADGSAHAPTAATRAAADEVPAAGEGAQHEGVVAEEEVREEDSEDGEENDADFRRKVAEIVEKWEKSTWEELKTIVEETTRRMPN